MKAGTGMTKMPKTAIVIRLRRRLGWLVLGLSLLASIPATGCRGFLEDQQEMWTDLYNRPDPLTVVKSTSAPDRRAKFIAQLKEPARNGGGPDKQEEVMGLLAGIAIHDPAPTCRLQAIRTLGSYQDSRRVKILQQAYDNAKDFSAEHNSRIRQQVLKALGETGEAAARAELVRVARASAKEDNSFDQQLTLDERQTAVRALGKFRGDPEATATLLHLLRTEKDVALRDCAHQSLESVTGKRLPTDLPSLEQVMNGSGTASPAAQNLAGPLQLLKGGGQK